MWHRTERATWLALFLRCTSGLNENGMFSDFIQDICLCYCLLAYFIWSGTDAESWVITSEFLFTDTPRIAEWMQSCPSWVIGIVEKRLDGSEISTQIRQILHLVRLLYGTTCLKWHGKINQRKSFKRLKNGHRVINLNADTQNKFERIYFPYARELGTCESFCCPWKDIYMAVYYYANQSGLK